MPYIRKEMRDSIDNGHDPINSGELNYLITRNLDAYIAKHGLTYDTLNSIVGVLECAKMELYRRVAAPYEDSKLRDNGDVYTAKGATQVAPPVVPPVEVLTDIRAYDNGLFIDRHFEVDYTSSEGRYEVSRHNRLYAAFCDYMRCLWSGKAPVLRMISDGGIIQASSPTRVIALLQSIGVKAPDEILACV